MFVNDKTNGKYEPWGYEISSEVKELIYDTLVAKSGGMYVSRVRRCGG